MQVNSISSQMNSKPAFSAHVVSGVDMDAYKKRAMANLKNFAELDDASVRKLAIQTASEKVNDKKHKKISNAIIYSIPVAAGLAAAIGRGGSRHRMLRSFVGNTAGWLGGFALIDAALAAKRKVEGKVPAAQKFNKEHPFLSLIGSLGVAALALFGGAKVFGKLNNKIMAKYGDKLVAKAQPIMKKVSQALNGSKVIDTASKLIGKVPAAIKSFAKGVINNGPLLLVGTSLAHTFTHEKAKNKEAVNSYIEIKNAQNGIKQALAEEAEV